MRVYSIFDKLSKKEGEFFFFENDDTAVRALSNQMIEEAKKNILFNVSDFELHVIEGAELERSADNSRSIVHVILSSGYKNGEDVTFESRFIYDFGSIDVEKIRQAYETERLSTLEKDIENIKTSIARRFS